MKFIFKLLTLILVFFLLIENTFAAATTTKVYRVPREGVRIKSSEANFSIFPDDLGFAPGRNIFIVSRKWQTACLYNEDGKLFVPGSTTTLATTTMDYLHKPLCVQSATGKKDLPTELGLYNIQTKQDKDYKSTFYTTTGDKPKDSKKDGAPMPYAMHIGRIIGLSPENRFWYDFSDGTAVHEKQTITKTGAMPFVSHGCIAVEKGMAATLQKNMSFGDLVLVINEKIPVSIIDMISISN